MSQVPFHMAPLLATISPQSAYPPYWLPLTWNPVGAGRQQPEALAVHSASPDCLPAPCAGCLAPHSTLPHAASPPQPPDTHHHELRRTPARTRAENQRKGLKGTQQTQPWAAWAQRAAENHAREAPPPPHTDLGRQSPLERLTEPGGGQGGSQAWGSLRNGRRKVQRDQPHLQDGREHFG